MSFYFECLCGCILMFYITVLTIVRFARAICHYYIFNMIERLPHSIYNATDEIDFSNFQYADRCMTKQWPIIYHIFVSVTVLRPDQ